MSTSSPRATMPRKSAVDTIEVWGTSMTTAATSATTASVAGPPSRTRSRRCTGAPQQSLRAHQQGGQDSEEDHSRAGRRVDVRAHDRGHQPDDEAAEDRTTQAVQASDDGSGEGAQQG